MTPQSPLHVDLVSILEATRDAERDLFAMLPPGQREVPGAIGTWSAKDVRAHLVAWRSIEARRLEAARTESGPDPADPVPSDPIDEANASLQTRYAEWTWDAVARESESSVDALIAAIRGSSTDVLCECDEGSVAGIGANGVNHAVGHLPEIAEMAGGRERFGAYVRELETVLGRGHLPPRDSGVILYNIACARALTGDLDDARRLLRQAFARRHDLVEAAGDDPDLAALGGELGTLA